MSGSDPALACGSLQRFKVAQQPARSEVRLVGGAQQALLCSPVPMSNFELGCHLLLMVKT